MEIGKQIKKYRSEMEVSQEELAERIFVSRQTISNWENDKNYPDLKSLLLLSSLFGVSLDILIKGDIEQMKEEIKTEDIKYLKRSDRIFTILLFSTLSLVFPFMILPILRFGLLSIWTYIGIGLWTLFWGATMFFAVRVQKLKNKFDIKSYKEIVAFMEGRALSEIDKQNARKKQPYPYQKWIYAGIFLFATVVPLLMFFVYYIFFMN